MSHGIRGSRSLHDISIRTLGMVIVLATLSSCTSFNGTPPMISVVEIDRFPVRVVTASLESRQPNQAVVLFESGGATPLETWDAILPEVATFAPLIAYDRAGTGGSAWDGVPPTPAQITVRLRRLLVELDVGPPFILVGHSWGGVLTRYFAGFHPEDVVGILYIDPTDITQTPEDEIAVFESIGAGVAERDAFHRMMEQSMSAGMPDPIRAESEVVMTLLRTDLNERGLLPPPDVPTSVVLAGRLMVLPTGILPFDTEAYARAIQEDRVRRLRTWAPGGAFVVAESAGHFVHVDDPELIIEIIRELTQAR